MSVILDAHHACTLPRISPGNIGYLTYSGLSMWFAKWFGGRSEEQHDDEPARYPPTPARVDSPAQNTRSPQVHNNIKLPLKTTKAKKGFDPYNSGAFERKSAWERTNLR